MLTFTNADVEFMRWRDTHPRGYIVNHDHEAKPSYLKLHRATCRTLASALPGRGDNWTGAYSKTCSDDINELRQWARVKGGELDSCRVCAP